MVQSVVVSIALMLISGFLMTRITKLLKLPNVTAYLIAGILIRPLFTSGILDMEVISGMSFLADIALAFIAFSIGQYFKIDVLKKNGFKTLIISLFDSVITMGVIFILTFVVFRLNLSLSLILSSIAPVTGITAIVIIVRQTNSKGDFVETLFEVIAIDILISIVLFSISLSVAETQINGEEFKLWTLLEPIITNLVVFIVGGLFGFIMKLLMPKRRTTDNRLIIAIAILFGFCGICAFFGVSPLLGCMSMGTIFYNTSKDDKMFNQLNYFSPPILLLFFVRSGINFDFNVFSDTSLILIVICYIIFRWIAKYAGSYLGALITHKNKDIRNNLGLALTPLGSISIGLAGLAFNHLSNDLVLANQVNTILIASIFIYELIGPALGKLALTLSHSYSDKLDDIVSVEEIDEEGNKKDEATLLVEKIKKIQETIPEISANENEKAFEEASELLYYNDHYQNVGVHRNRRLRK